MGCLQDLSSTLSALKLLKVCSDPDGDTLSITSVSSFSEQGGMVQLWGTSITYKPAARFVGTDRFNYSVTDSCGDSAQGTVIVIVSPLESYGSRVLRVSMVQGQAIIKFAGIPGITYEIEACDDVAKPSWQKAGALRAELNGRFEFLDNAVSQHPVRYYRVIIPEMYQSPAKIRTLTGTLTKGATFNE